MCIRFEFLYILYLESPTQTKQARWNKEDCYSTFYLNYLKGTGTWDKEPCSSGDVFQSLRNTFYPAVTS